VEAPASRLAKLELRHLGSQAGAWEPAKTTSKKNIKVSKTPVDNTSVGGNYHHDKEPKFNQTGKIDDPA